jgi:hypothetical protein
MSQLPNVSNLDDLVRRRQHLQAIIDELAQGGGSFGARDFLAFAEREFSGENVDFLVAVREFRRHPTVEGAASIRDRFLDPDAKQLINLPHAVSQSLLQATDPQQLQQIAPASNVFNQAEGEILSLLARDTYPRWKRTQGGKDGLADWSTFVESAANPVTRGRK